MTEQPAPAAGWTVTGQQETMDLSPQGTYVNGVKVSFRTASGAIGSVFVPMDAFTPELVRQKVAAAAATVEHVAGLTG